MKPWTDEDSRELDAIARALRRQVERRGRPPKDTTRAINTGPARGPATDDDQARRKAADQQMRRP
jgi:hypothetical protein